MDSKMNCTIWTRFLCHFQNGASLFCTPKNVKVIKQFVNFHSFCMRFAKIALVTIYMRQTLKTWSHFFYKGSFHLLKIFLELISMVKVHEIAKMCQIFGYFSFYYCKSLSNTFLSWGTPKWCPRKLRFESCGYFDVIFDLKGIKNKISNFWHISLYVWNTL